MESECGVLCLKASGSIIILVQCLRGFSIHILKEVEQMKSFCQFSKDILENKFTVLPPEETEKIQIFLERLNKDSRL